MDIKGEKNAVYRCTFSYSLVKTEKGYEYVDSLKKMNSAVWKKYVQYHMSQGFIVAGQRAKANHVKNV